MKKGISVRKCTLAALAFCALFSAGGRHTAADPLWPRSSGESRTDGKLCVDAGFSSEGYLLAKVSELTSHRMKLRVKKEDELLTYDLNGEGEEEVIPLQLGSGEYQVMLYENVGGKKYSLAGSLSLEVSLSREDIPFLYPNQYVSYGDDSPLIDIAGSLCEGKSQKESFEAIRDFMTSEFVYDYVRSLTVKAGTLPDIAYCYENRMGICQDLSAVMIAMLRMQGIPSKLMIGYADDNYHAWTQTTVDGEEIPFDPTAALDAIEKPRDYTTERFY